MTLTLTSPHPIARTAGLGRLAGLLASLLLVAACTLPAATPPASTPMAMTARLSGSSEVPPVPGSGSGNVEGMLNQQSGVLSWTVTHSGLSGPVTAAHFHGPALVGQNAGVVVPIGGAMDSPIKGQATLTAPQMADLLAGRWYVNLHTAANPNGEIRGQVAVLQ